MGAVDRGEVEVDRLGMIVMSTGTGRALWSVNGGANDTFHDIPVKKKEEEEEEEEEKFRS